MGQTTLNNLPYPEATAQPYVHLDMKALADATAARLFVTCTSSTRPPHLEGRRIYETNTGTTYISTGGTWVALVTDPTLSTAVTPKLFVTCTSSTRPAHLNGRRIYETDTTLSYISTAGAWVPVVTETQAVIGIASGYSAFEGAPKYFRQGSVAFASGGVFRSAATANVAASTPFGVAAMPTAVRPPASRRLGVAPSFGGPCTVRYDSVTGQIQVEYGTAATLTQGVWWVSLSGINWEVP